MVKVVTFFIPPCFSKLTSNRQVP